MDRIAIGELMCLGAFLVPLVLGVILGMWFQRRKDLLGMPGAVLPGFIRRLLESQEWK